MLADNRELTMCARATVRAITRPRKCAAAVACASDVTSNQLCIVHAILAHIDRDSALPADARLAQSHILAKLRGYQAQDAPRSSAPTAPSAPSAPTPPITLHQCCTLLADHQLQCTFCHRPLLLLYSLAYEGAQWTLDRIDNSLGHTLQNVLPACLTCNLRRRRQSHHRFALKKTTYIVHRNP